MDSQEKVINEIIEETKQNDVTEEKQTMSDLPIQLDNDIQPETKIKEKVRVKRKRGRPKKQKKPIDINQNKIFVDDESLFEKNSDEKIDEKDIDLNFLISDGMSKLILTFYIKKILGSDIEADQVEIEQFAGGLGKVISKYLPKQVGEHSELAELLLTIGFISIPRLGLLDKKQ